MVEVVGAKRVGELRVDPVHAPGPAILFVKADQQAGLVLPAVVVRDRAAQQRHPVTGLRDLRDLLGHEILMFHGHDRVMHPHHGADFVHPIAAGVDDNLRVDFAPGRGDDPAVVGQLAQRGDGGLAMDFGPGKARAAGQRLAQLRRVDVAIQRVPEPADKGVGGNQRVAAGAFGGVDDLEMHPHATRHRRKVAIAIHLCLRVGQPDAAVGVVVGDGILRVLRQFLVQRDRVAFQADHRLGHAEIRHLCR